MDTTPTPNVPDAQEPATSPGENWEQRYIGLQKIVAKRDEALHTTSAALDALQAEHEAAVAKLGEYAQKDVDESEETASRATYEALKERFQEVPRPIGNQPMRDWTNPAKREVQPERSEGFPT